MGEATTVDGVNWVERAIEQIGGPSEAIRVLWDHSRVRVSAVTLYRAKKAGKITNDTGLACALSELTGISVFLLSGRPEPTTAPGGRRGGAARDTSRSSR